MPAQRLLPSCLLLLYLLLVPTSALAQTRAWLDRDRIQLGQSTTLNIQTDQGAVTTPDYTPLQSDFRVSGHTSSRSFEVVNGNTRTRVLFAVALEPRRSGNLAIPALRVGNARTAALRLQVMPANTAIAPAPARSGEPIFVEAQADTQQPYVQQAVGYVVRLYYATQLISGSLTQASPDGAALQQVGQERQYTEQIGNNRYNVVERRYLLIPERSGALTIPGARFEGQGVGGFFDDLFGDGRRDLRANGQARQLHVRPPPPNAPQPWLPLHGLQLRYVDAPQGARAGDAAAVVIEMLADGASATQLPELRMDAGRAAQVFPEPPQLEESVRDGRPVVRVTRKFSIVPAQAGDLRIDGPRIAWWDVQAGSARSAALPPLTLQVAVGANGQGAAAADRNGFETAMGQQRVRVPFVQGAVPPWALVAVIFALLWLATLWWGLKRSQPVAAVPAAAVDQSAMPMPTAARASLRELQQALDLRDLPRVAHLLCAMASPPAVDLRELRERLDDIAQRDAIDALQRARWGEGDPQAACQQVRTAFADGPHWRAATKGAGPVLPPLYPKA